MNYLIPVVVVALIGLIAGIILTIFSKLMAVSVDERVALIREVLPGANCGACGFAGCDDYAAALGSDSDVAPNLCPPGGTSVAAQIAEILGVDAGSTEAKYAEVLCKGSCEHTKPLMEYQGIKTCKAVKNFFGGHGSCRYGCLGFGDCVTACPYDAIHVVDGVAIVDRNNCVGCGLCVKACPNDIIQIAPDFPRVYRESRTDVSPVLAPIAHIDATYTPSIRLPTRIIHKRLSKLKAAPKDAPEAIVGVKKVNPMRTALIGRSPFLAVAGT